MQTEDLRFRCPSCQGKLKVDPLHRGRAVSCPKCADTITIPTDVTEAFTCAFKVLDKARRTLDAATKLQRECVEKTNDAAHQVRQERDEFAAKLKERVAEIAEAHSEIHRLSGECEKARAVARKLAEELQQEQVEAVSLTGFI